MRTIGLKSHSEIKETDLDSLIASFEKKSTKQTENLSMYYSVGEKAENPVKNLTDTITKENMPQFLSMFKAKVEKYNVRIIKKQV